MEIPTLDKLETKLFKAIRDGKVKKVRALMQKGVNLDCKNNYGKTPLHYAVAALGVYKKETIVELLLQNGAKIEEKNSNGQTPLEIAVLNEQTLVAKIILKHGADVNVKRKLGHSLLHTAISFGNVSLVEILLEYGAEVDSPTENGLTPLMRVICLAFYLGTPIHEEEIFTRHNSIKITEMLLRYDASINVRNEEGNSLLECTLIKENGKKLDLMKIISHHHHNSNFY